MKGKAALLKSKRGLLVVVGVSIATAVMGACSSDHENMGAAAVSPDAEYNIADAEFAQGMIVHHGQAVTMADLALVNSSNPAVLELAQEIKDAQEPEIAQMSAWLTRWEQPVPDLSMDHASMDHGSMPMTGMLSQDRLDELRRASGPDFDELFLDAMIEHHRGAIQMAEYVLASGKYPPVASLAQDVIRVQETEIAEMENLLAL